MPVGSSVTTVSAPSLNLAISGGRLHTLNLVNNQASGGGTNTTSPLSPAEPRSSWWSRWRNRGIVIGIATVVSAGVAVATWFGWVPVISTSEPVSPPAVEAPR